MIELLVAFSVLTLKIDFCSTDLFSKNTGGVVEVTLTFPSSTRCIPKSHRHRPSYQLCSHQRNWILLSPYPPRRKLLSQTHNVLLRSPVSELGSGALIVNNPIQPSKAIQVEGRNNTHIIQDKHSLAWKYSVGSFPLNLAESGLNFAWPI